MRQSSSNNHDRGGGDKPGRGGASPPPKGPGKAGEGPARPHSDRTPDRSHPLPGTSKQYYRYAYAQVCGPSHTLRGGTSLRMPGRRGKIAQECIHTLAVNLSE